MKKKIIILFSLLLLSHAHAEDEERREKAKEAIFQSARISRLKTQNDFFYEKLDKLEKQNKEYAVQIQHLTKTHAEEIKRMKQDMRKAQLKTQFLEQLAPLVNTLATIPSGEEELFSEPLKNPEDHLPVLFYKTAIEGQSFSPFVTPVMQLTQTMVYLMNREPNDIKNDDFSLEKHFIEKRAKRYDEAFENIHLKIENIPLKRDFFEEKQSLSLDIPKNAQQDIGVNTEPLKITSIGINTERPTLEIADNVTLTLPKRKTESLSIGTDAPEMVHVGIQTHEPLFEDKTLWIERKNTAALIKNLNISSPLALDISTLPGANMASTFKQTLDRKIDDLKSYYTKEIHSKNREIHDINDTFANQRAKLQNELEFEIKKSNSLVKKYASLELELWTQRNDNKNQQNDIILENMNLSALNQELTSKLLTVQETLKTNEQAKEKLEDEFVYQMEEQNKKIKKLQSDLQLIENELFDKSKQLFHLTKMRDRDDDQDIF